MLAPKLRFKEFNDEWNYNLFNEIFEFIQNNSFSRDMLNYSENSKIYNIHYGDILTKYGEIIDFNLISNIVPKINNDISLSKFEDKSYLKNGDIIIADTAEDLTVGKSCEVVNLHCKALAGLHTIPCRPKFKFTSQYLGTYINSTSYHSQLIPYITGIKVSSISKNNIIKTKIYFPTIKEQEKISKLFSLLNKKIELQQRKIEVLKMYKRGLMCYMFNSISEYSTNKLKDICTIEKGQQLNHENMLNFGKYYVLNGGSTLSGYTNSYNTLENTISISEGGNSCGYVNYNIQKFWAGGHCYTLKKISQHIDDKYLFQVLKFNQGKIMKLRVGSGLPNIQKKSLENFELKIHNQYNQHIISKLFSNFDKKLEYETCIFTELTLFKKSLLQQMFI